MEGIDSTYIKKCLHDPEKAPLCPIFKLGDIVKLSGFKFETIAKEVSQLHLINTQHWMERIVLQVERRIYIPLITAAHNNVMYDALVSWQGGAIGIVVDWTCNLDVDIKHCKPKYNFHGLYGNPNEKDKARASVGYNFRCVDTVYCVVFTLQIYLLILSPAVEISGIYAYLFSRWEWDEKNDTTLVCALCMKLEQSRRLA